jgi:hypothetical protein
MLEHIYLTTQHHIPQAWLHMKLETKWQWNLRQVCDQYMAVSCKGMCREQKWWNVVIQKIWNDCILICVNSCIIRKDLILLLVLLAFISYLTAKC